MRLLSFITRKAVKPRQDMFRHDITEDGYETLCGLRAEDATEQLDIACGCRRPECLLPVTCPACKATLTGKVN